MSDEFSEGLPKRTEMPSESPVERGEFSERASNPPKPLPLSPQDEDDFDNKPIRHSSEDRLIGAIVHPAGGFTWFLAPLIIYLVQQDRKSLAAWHAREAFNFQLSTTIYYLLPCPLFCLTFVDISLLPFAVGLPFLFMFVVLLFELVVVILASIAAYRGQFFRCPLNIPFIPRPDLTIYSDDHADLD